MWTLGDVLEILTFLFLLKGDALRLMPQLNTPQLNGKAKAVSRGKLRCPAVPVKQKKAPGFSG